MGNAKLQTSGLTRKYRHQTHLLKQYPDTFRDSIDSFEVSPFFVQKAFFLVLNLVLLHKTKINGGKREISRTIQETAKGFYL